MRWKRGRRSGDLIDRRGARGAAVGGAAIGLPALLVIGAIYLFSNLFGGGGSLPPIGEVIGELAPAEEGTGQAPPRGSDPEARLVDFMSFVLDDVQDHWERSFSAAGKDYQRAELVLFEGRTSSACGGASTQIGPHYCPADNRVYLDLSFFRELRNRFGAPGDFAQAYVIAHEIAHHVQTVLGINGNVQRRQRENPDEANQLSVMLELQADCLSGVWGSTAKERGLLEPGDLEEGLNAAAAIGDDRIQEKSGGRIEPENWTHGSSEQRMSWFERGFDTGDPDRCDTFAEM